jgi:predicted HTH transcriptional regulator
MLRWTDRIYPDGTWEANLFQFFYKTYRKLSQLLPTPFMLKGIDRQEETTAHIALREALANCLIHCNYAQIGNILVVGRNSSIMMRNPGCMLISIDEFYAGSHSICRNPTLQKLFMFLGYGEKAGSGADIIRKGWDDNNWPMPVLTERVQPEETLMTLVITSSDSSKVSPENIKMSPETDGMSPENAQTSPETNVVSPEMSPENVQTSQKIIELIRNNKNITMQEMANVLGLNKRSVARNIKKLQEHGLIRRVGANKNGYWEISA